MVVTGRWSEEERLAALAHRVALATALEYVPRGRRQDAADAAMAIALGILHGCCGPNGDFTASYRPPLRGVPSENDV